MRIGVITGIFPPDIGGPARYVPKMAAELRRRGHDVSVLCLSDDPGRDGRDAWPFPVHRVRRGLFLPLRLLAVIVRAVRLGRSSDVLYVNGLGFEAWIASRLCGVPAVHKVVGDYAWERARNKGWFPGTVDAYQTAKKSLRLKLMDWTRTQPLRAADSIIVPSRYLKRILTGWGVDAAKIRVVYNAVEPASTPAPSLEGRGRVFATVCRLVPWKCVDGLLRVLAKLPEWRLEVAGGGPLRAELETLAASLGVSDRVTFHGNVPEETVSEVLRRARVFVLNSTYEGLPHVVLEAMREGALVAATDVGGTGELVVDGETGLLLPASDDAALEAALRRLDGEAGLAERLLRGAEEKVRAEFSYEAMAAGAEEELARAAANGKRA